jgi:radical SAM superfamily enzyme YgiQ (UPF0313 family)
VAYFETDTLPEIECKKMSNGMNSGNKPRVLLVATPQILGKQNIWNLIRGFPPPLGLACLAAYLEKAGIDVEIIDAYAENLDPDKFRRELINRRKPDIIGFTSTTSIIHTAYMYSRIARDIFPDRQIVFGGVHATALPEEVLSQKHVDYVVRGEGEQTFLELVGGVAPEKINGLSYRKGTQMHHNPDREFIDLELLPMPAYHLLPMHKYRLALGAAKRRPATSMMIARGCPNRCSFCYGDMFGRKIRRKSLDQVLEEIKFLQSRFHIREISFYDDTFTYDKKFIVQLCEQFIRDGIDLSWSCFSRVDFIDRSVLKLMKAAGCHQLMYGLESADESILKELNKNQTIQNFTRAVEVTKEENIDVRVAFMIGNPGETRESIDKTIDYVIRISPDMVVANITTPYPGTALYNWAKKEGVLLTEDWTKYELSNVIIDIPGLPAKFIEKRYRTIYRRFYLRPSYLLRRLTKMRTGTQWIDAVQAFGALLVR